MNMHISPHSGPPSAFEAFTGTPLPEDPIRALKRLRAAAAADVLRLIAFLDETDGDPDLDPNGDDEPSLGWTNDRTQFGYERGADRELDAVESEPDLASPESCGSQLAWARGGSHDRELDLDLTEADELDVGEHDRSDDEPSLGAPDSIEDQQTAWGMPTWDRDDEEASLGSTNSTSQLDWGASGLDDREHEHDGREDGYASWAGGHGA